MYHEIYSINNISQAIAAAEKHLKIKFEQFEINSMENYNEVQIYDNYGDDWAWVWYDQNHHLVVIRM